MTTAEIPQNYAPLRELDEAKQQQADRFVKKSPLEFFTKLRDEMRREKESEEWVKRFMASQKNELYFRGYQRLSRSPLTNTWYVEDPKPVHFTLNEFQFWVNVNCSKANHSRVEFRFKGLSDLDDAEMAANKLRVIADHYDGKTWNRTRTIKAWKGLQFTGHLVAYVYYDPEAEAGKAYRPVTDRMPVKLGPDAYRCTACGHVGEIEEDDSSGRIGRNDNRPSPFSGPEADPMVGMGEGEPVLPGDGPDVAAIQVSGVNQQLGMSEAAKVLPDQPLCENCQSPALDITRIPSINYEQEVGRERIKTGDVVDELISIYNITWNAKLGLEKSPIVLWEEDHDSDDLKATYQGINIPQSHTDDIALTAKAGLEHINRTDRTQSTRVTLSRMWVEPRRYFNVELQEEVKTFAGATFPAGTKLIEICPEGVHVIMIDKLIVDLYPAVKNDDLVMMEYHGNPNGGLAQGCDAMCEPQRMSNTGHSLWNLWMRHHAQPNSRFNPDLVDPADIKGDPTTPMPVNASMLGLTPSHTMEQAIVRDQPTPFPQGIWQGLQAMRNFIQFAALATEFSDALPGVNNETLGGARIGQSLSQSVSGTMLAQFADFRVGITMRKIKKFKRYCWDQRYVEFSGKYGDYEGMLIGSMDIPDDFEIEAVDGSWLPRTAEQRQQNLMALLQSSGGVIGFLQSPPAVQSELLKTYDVKFGEDIYPVAIRTVRLRLRQAKTLLPELMATNEELAMAGVITDMQMSADVDPMTGQPVMLPLTVGQQLFSALNPPPNPREKGHEEAADYISSWYTMDEGLNAPKELIEFMDALQDFHLESMVTQGQVQQGMDLAVSPPPMEGGGPPVPSKGAKKPPGEPKQPNPGAIGGAG